MTGLQDKAIERIINGDDARFNAMGAELKDPTKTPSAQVKDSGLGSFLSKVKADIGGALDSVFDKSAAYDKEAQKAYENRASIVSTFAAEYRSGKISPDTMKNMEYLKDKNALATGDSSARISDGLYDYVKQNLTSFGLTAKETATYQGGKQDITIYGSMNA